jgi:catechol 2,3-dioxygenase-like lactoylglutathione lyase family enzyme
MKLHHLTLRVSELDRSVKFHKSLGLTDGHRLFIYHAGANRLNPPWRLP